MENNDLYQQNTQAQNAYGYTAPTFRQPEDSDDPVIRRKKVKKSYGAGTTTMVIQFILLQVIATIGQFIYMVPAAARLVAENPELANNPTELTPMMISAMQSDGFFMILLNSISYLIANPIAFFIGLSLLGKPFGAKDIFGRMKPVKALGFGFIGVLGIQGLSMVIQHVATMISGMTGVSENMMNMLSFSDNTVQNIVMLLYIVIIAPVTEELLLRGLVLNALSPVDKRFALFASALMFGIFHGNLNQIFNGFLLGLIFGYIALKTGSVKGSIIAHIIANANVMIMSGVYENLIGGDTGIMIENIYMVVMLVAGIIGLVIFLRANGKITSEDKMADYSIDLPEAAGGASWKILLTRPSFWIFTICYAAIAISQITAVSAG